MITSLDQRLPQLQIQRLYVWVTMEHNSLHSRKVQRKTNAYVLMFIDSK